MTKPETNMSTVEVDVDEYFGVAIDSQLGLNMTAQVSDMLDPGFLKQFGESYYRQFAAILAKQLLRSPLRSTSRAVQCSWPTGSWCPTGLLNGWLV